MKIQTPKPSIATQTAHPARFLPFRSHAQTPSIRPDQQDAEAFYSRIGAQTAAVVLAGLAMTTTPSPALAAGSNPFNAVATFYRERQQANGPIFLGPIQLSRQRLETAAAALQGTEGEKYTTAMASVRAASLDCIVVGDDFEKKQDLTTASSTAAEYKFGDPCKLRLITKNATALTKDKKLVAETEAKMVAFIRQLQLLEDRLDRATQGDNAETAGGKGIPELLQEAVNLSVEFEETVKDALGI